ncbi:MAG: diguanylate cyclase (GGDEF)-like protein [Desulforhopalus sp.]|jgi:diguanylate cyclase (GGDEF)-like protein
MFFIFYGNVPLALATEPCVNLNAAETTYLIDGAIKSFEDKSTNKSIQNIRNIPPETWTLEYASAPSFGFSNSAFWLNLTICGSQNPDKNIVLEVGYPLLDFVDLYVVENEKIILASKSGDQIAFSQRPEQHRNFLFNLRLQEQDLNIYIRVLTKSSVQIPIKLYSVEGFFQQNQTSLILQGCYFGIILAMILYNTFLFFSLREWSYLLYVLFTLSYFSFQGVLQGFFQQYVFASMWWQDHSLLIFGYLTILFSNLFAISFLNLTDNGPILKRILQSMGFIAVIFGAFASFLPYGPMIKLMLLLAIPCALLIMCASLRLWWSGHLPARIFTLAWFTLLGAFVLASLSKFDLLPRGIWTDNIMQIGGVIEVILLSIALGERINEEKRQRILAEQTLSSSLERMVKERTLELKQALKQLETANTTLDKMTLTDALTQISNRRAFDTCIEQEFSVAKKNGKPLALIMIDIDHFKNFNDTYGHQIGDEVLKNVAQILRSLATRPRDMAFRYGGEEFAVVLSTTDRSGATIVAEKIRAKIEATPILINDTPCFITISAGISILNSKIYDIPTQDMEEFIRMADTQLYRAKTNGRNRVAVAEISQS